MDVSDNIIVYEYEEEIMDRKIHYVGYYDKNIGEFKPIMSNNGKYINDDMFFPSVSKDGKYIVFSSRATNITTDDKRSCYSILDQGYDNCSDIYVYDLDIQISYMIKNGTDYLNGDSYVAKISGSGKSIVFESLATNILNFGNLQGCIKSNENTCINIYKYSMAVGTVSLISTLNDNYGGDGNSISPSISYDGRYITFQSTASNLVDESYNLNTCNNLSGEGIYLCSQIYLYDCNYNVLNVISTKDNVLFNNNSGNALINEQGNVIVYESYATNIEENYSRNLNIIAYDVIAQKNKIISKNNGIFNNRDSYLIDVSNDGKYVVYQSKSTNLNGIGNTSIYIYNYLNNKVSLFSSCQSDFIFARINNESLIYYDNEIMSMKIDVTAPYIMPNQEIFILKNSKTNLKDKIIVDDNLSDKIELYIADSLISNKVGEYLVDVAAVDEFANVGYETVKIIVLECDEEGPIFTDINEIKVLKGSTTLNLLNYIEAKDKVDGKTRIYIMDDGNLDLNKKGKYKIRIMSKDASENVSEKELYVVVYENINFSYYYELILILGIIAVIIFSIIKVK